MAKKKKEETMEDIIDRMDEDLQKLRDKAIESSEEEWDDEEDLEDEDDEEDED